jgi:predicted ester cyclase
MTIEQNKAIARRFIEEIFVRQDPDAVDELVAPDFLPHDWGLAPQGREAIRGAIKRASAGLSDVKMTIEDVIAEGDRVALRLTSSARQTGEFMGMPPSGNRYSIPEIHILRIRDGQVAEHWHQLDLPGMKRQLEAKEVGEPVSS